ncbi:AMP-binding protein (plasmid) [Tistrella bauzanensis]|uniref:AMP-binding protein n=1 Tax=Tistrella TaxID=171436 RepID=UPI0031F63830
MSDVSPIPGQAALAARADCVLPDLLDRWAAGCPERPFAVFPDGAQWSYGEMRGRVRRMAAALQALGVGPGDPVVVWLPNGGLCLTAWFAINYAGAVYVPINTAYRGGILEHVIRVSSARLMITIGQLAQRLAIIDRSRIDSVIVADAADDVAAIVAMPALDGIAWRGGPALDSAADPTPLSVSVEPWDTQSVIYTSGTTGPSKGVLSSYAHLHAMGTSLIADPRRVPYLGPDDRFMINLPLFHVGGTAPVYAMLARGGAVVLVDGFDTRRFWQVVDATGTTAVILLGVMAAFLLKDSHRGDAQGSPLAHVIAIPLTEDGIAFRRRFGVTLHTLFNMSEVSCPLVAEDNPTVIASCGRPRDGVTVQLVDAHDRAVAPGETGELVIRTDLPWQLTHGYQSNPDATAAVWRNGWFHTGDAFRVDGDGNYFFVDRFKDSIRRRGENVSSFEVEAEICAHPAVREAAVVAVPAAESEDEILVAVSLADGATLSPQELIEHLRPRMAHFMIPRYVRMLANLPKTPTNKVEKYLIRKDGVTADTWDRDAAGIVVKREKIGHT